MLKIREDVFEKLDGYDPIKINGELYVVKHIHQIDDTHAKFQLITTNHSGTKIINGQYDAIVDVKILTLADFALMRDLYGLITLLNPNDYLTFLQNVINFGRMFDNAQYRVIQIAASKVFDRITRLEVKRQLFRLC